MNCSTMLLSYHPSEEYRFNRYEEDEEYRLNSYEEEEEEEEDVYEEEYRHNFYFNRPGE